MSTRPEQFVDKVRVMEARRQAAKEYHHYQQFQREHQALGGYYCGEEALEKPEASKSRHVPTRPTVPAAYRLDDEVVAPIDTYSHVSIATASSTQWCSLGPVSHHCNDNDPSKKDYRGYIMLFHFEY